MNNSRAHGFTLLELLVVVLIIGILALIISFNMRVAVERAWKASDAANLHTLAAALQTYYMDHGELPLGDHEAGPFMSHTPDFDQVGNGPAGGGSWDGVPWLLYEYGYVSSWTVFFNPKYLRRLDCPQTIRGGYPRFHNFRYAYNSANASAGGHAGGSGDIMSGETWLLRDIWIGPRDGFYAANYPGYPADYEYPWGEGEYENKLEHAVYADLAVRLVIGGTDERVE
ncbi:prepilin-type N-terminal cleavage/methylation domain-containing protein [Candidatus Sumerlaeota bacterium]|nr:prepilin-type N-terminal cleavage/methylation domain-containing protein [Candidatus Sumerlaeota bacterium]